MADPLAPLDNWINNYTRREINLIVDNNLQSNNLKNKTTGVPISIETDGSPAQVVFKTDGKTSFEQNDVEGINSLTTNNLNTNGLLNINSMGETLRFLNVDESGKKHAYISWYNEDGITRESYLGHSSDIDLALNVVNEIPNGNINYITNSGDHVFSGGNMAIIGNLFMNNYNINDVNEIKSDSWVSTTDGSNFLKYDTTNFLHIQGNNGIKIANLDTTNHMNFLQGGFDVGIHNKFQITNTINNMFQQLNMNGFTIENTGDPVNTQDVATKNYVDNAISSGVVNDGSITSDKLSTVINMKYLSADNFSFDNMLIDGNATISKNPNFDIKFAPHFRNKGFCSGYNNTFFINGVDRKVYSIGKNDVGQLGYSTGGVSTNTLQVIPNIEQAIYVHSIYNHTAVIVADGSLYVFGANTSGQLGKGDLNNTSTPTKITFSKKVVDVATSLQNTGVVLEDGTVWMAGSNNSKQLGNGSTDVNSNVFVQVTGITNAVGISLGQEHAVALLSDGTLKSWGRGDFGQLGTSTIDSNTIFSLTIKDTPVVVDNITDAVAVRCTRYTTFVLKSDGTVHAFGSNSNYEIGDGTTDNKYLPFQLPSISNCIALECNNATLALLSSGEVLGWGIENLNNLGTENSTTPQPISNPNLQNVNYISIGLQNTIYIQNDGTVYAMGNNFDSQLTNVTTPNDTLTEIPDFTNFDKYNVLISQAKIICTLPIESDVLITKNLSILPSLPNVINSNSIYEMGVKSTILLSTANNNIILFKDDCPEYHKFTIINKVGSGSSANLTFDFSNYSLVTVTDVSITSNTGVSSLTNNSNTLATTINSGSVFNYIFYFNGTEVILQQLN